MLKELISACLEDKEGLNILKTCYPETRDKIELLLVITDWEEIKKLREEIYLIIN